MTETDQQNPVQL